jgi:hypothetical protein
MDTSQVVDALHALKQEVADLRAMLEGQRPCALSNLVDLRNKDVERRKQLFAAGESHEEENVGS